MKWSENCVSSQHCMSQNGEGIGLSGLAVHDCYAWLLHKIDMCSSFSALQCAIVFGKLSKQFRTNCKSDV